MSSRYSVWPIILVIYNLPPWLCMKRRHMILTLLISGPHQPGNNIDIYLAPLIDDLKHLWEVGVETYDAYNNEKFLLQAVLLWTINDFPAYGNLSGCKVKGYLACPICADQTNAKRLKHSRKMSYTGHRRFLNDNHPYRRHKKTFNGKNELRCLPTILTGTEVRNKMEGMKCVWGKQNKKKQSKADVDNIPWKKKSIFFELEYWEHLHVHHILDVMHIEKNVCESLFSTLLNIPGKTKDGVNARLDLVDMDVRDELTPKIGGKKTYLPPACYTLNKEEKRQVLAFFVGVKVPTGYSSNVSSLLSTHDLKLVGLKSHDCHNLMQQLLPVAIRGVLPKQVRNDITRLCFFFNVLCSKVVDVSKLDSIQADITVTLCQLEKYFPPAFFDIMVHLIVHLVREVKLCGPVWYTWMYPFERFMQVLKGYVRNQNCPEGCIAECYIAEEALEFCSEFFSNVCTTGLPSTHRQIKQTKPLSAPQIKSIDEKEWEHAHLYVLTNDDIVNPYIEAHFEYLNAMFPKKKSGKWLQDEHNRAFIPWLRKKVVSATVHSTQQISERLKWLARGPNGRVLMYAYMINGVTFHTKKRDGLRETQNCGLSFVVPDTWEKRCLQSAAKKWCEYKSTLYKKNILPYKHDHERLIQPPSGSKIKLDDWNAFVIARLSESSQEEELTGDEEIDRVIMWKQARVNERGEFADEVLSQKVHQIDECIRQKADGVLSRPHPDADILTHVLQKSDSRGHVRGLGGLVSPSTICITNKSSSSTNRKLLQEMAELRAIVSQLQQQQQVVPKNDDGEQKASCSAAQKSVDDFQIIDDAEFLEVRRPKKKGMSPPKLLAKLNVEDLPRPLKNLVSYARKALNDGHSIPCIIDENVFGHVVNSYIFIEDICHMCEKKPITVSTICTCTKNVT